jgi:hypothetical protein
MSSVQFLSRAIVLGLLVAAGCRTVRREVVIPPQHPASPDAAEAPLPAESTTLAVEPTAAPQAGAGATPSAHGAHHAEMP